MNTYKLSLYILFALFATIILLLTACQPAPLATTEQPTQSPVQPSATVAIAATQSSNGATAEITLDYSAVAQNVTFETVAAASASDGEPWVAAPEYRLVTLQGYPVTGNSFKPQIFIYPAADLASANENMGKVAADLQALLQTQQAGEELPFLPLPFSSKQAIRAQVKYLDFGSGKGIRFLTQFNNGLVSVNNSQLIYTFQGLTSDGKYYIAAILPVTNPELPNDATVDEKLVANGGYLDFLSQMATMLDQQPGGNFTPDLDKLDAMIRSIEVK